MSGKNLIKMDALKALFSDLGFTDVSTYIQSGNVVFQSELTDAATVGRLIQEGILNRFELKVPVLIRGYNELKNNSITPGRDDHSDLLNLC